MPFAAGSSRAGLAGGPEVLNAGKADNVFGVHADLLGEHVQAFLIAVPDSHPKAVGVEAIFAVLDSSCKEIVSVVNRAFFEVVPKREVAVHLEKSAMARGMSDIVNIVCTNALLH